MDMISTPILLNLLINGKDRYIQSVQNALDTLNRGLEEKKIYNVEINDAKFSISSAIDDALSVITNRMDRGVGYRYEPWENDFSSYCSFNQAAGRIKRLTKNGPTDPKFIAIVADYIEALKEVDAIWKAICELKPVIVKGRRPNQNKTEEQIAEELCQTGVCAICAHTQKLENKTDKLVMHGYKMSDYNHSGYRMGSCFAVGYLPYELSNEACVAYQPILADYLKRSKSYLRSLQSGKHTKFEIEVSEYNYKTRKSETRNIIAHKGVTTYVKEFHATENEKFESELEYRKYQTEREISSIESDIEINDAKITNWTLQPLKYGRYSDKKATA